MLLTDLVDRPTAMVFFYTRCDNPAKCSRTVNRLGELHRAAEATGLAGRVRLLAISFEPESDTPDLLDGYARLRGLRPGTTLRLVRPDPARHRDLHRGLDVPVNYNGGSVNLHGVGLYLLDARGRHVRTHHTLIWDTGRVLDDLKRLVEENRERVG
jgi:protein SCO1/2